MLGTITESGLSNLQLTDGDEQPFIYSGASAEASEDSASEDGFIYPGATVSPDEIIVAQPPQSHPSPAQLESLYAAASSGDLPLLKKLFKTALDSGTVDEPFSLANDASSRTGFTALHAAARSGYLDIVIWLVEDCGAMPDLEDKEGETALHKAALNGHLPIIMYLLPVKADVHARDADGWTALHNACSKVTTESDGVRGVDIRSQGGWTPLMNAASKGHLPVVLYLLNKQSANPLVRNNWGETAYDAAAAVFEVWICEVLQGFEAEQWRRTTVSYDPLAVHTTVPLVLYENQRLDMRLKTLATFGRPKFSTSGLGKQGRRAPFELKLPKPDEDTGAREIPTWRSNVHLPLRDSPWKLPKPVPNERLDSAERSHFWLSDWTLDVTHPGVDADEGWQYAHRFGDPNEQWTAEIPSQLERTLNGGVVSNTFGGPSTGSSSRSPQTWVRRRRWVRVMRRRLDMPPLPFLEPDGNMYDLDSQGKLVPHLDDQHSDYGEGDGQELGTMVPSFLAASTDYVSRARYLVGVQTPSPNSAMEIRRAIAKLERATTELRQGILSDSDTDRKTQAEVLLNAYSRELERRRLAAGAQGLLISRDAHRPGSRASGSTDYFTSRPASQRTTTDLTPQLSQAPDFRVPTHEAPQKVLSARRTLTPYQVHPQWERDEAAHQCRDCQRRFNFLTRRHCRKSLLDPAEIVQDPSFTDPAASTSSQRVCQACHDEVSASVPDRLRGMGANSMERVFIEQDRLSIPGHLSRRQSSSQLSDLAECPVCNINLDNVGNVSQQEAHVRSCLEGGSTTPQAAKYLVYQLPTDSRLIGAECVICLEEFTKGSTVARLSCFCSFHSHCLSSWLQRGKSCPVHAR
ncbi:hypothetical protein C8J56DRAFT_1003730 [Mycena floridula]|nr:hypothetical protein C8J56DRAFT_1003730 [Mycena floridula]